MEVHNRAAAGRLNWYHLLSSMVPERVTRTCSRAQVDRLDFRSLLRNVIGQQSRAPLPIRDNTAPTSMVRHDTAQVPASQSGIKHLIKRAIRFTLIPVKPAARYAREFLISHLQATVDTLRAETRTVQLRQSELEERTKHIEELVQGGTKHIEELVQGGTKHIEELVQGRSRTVEDLMAHALELMQTLHGRVEDIALRSRGALPIDEATFALRTLDGFVFIPRQDTLLLLMLLDAGPEGLEPGTRRVLTKLLRPGMTFVDVGAHVGLLTLAGARAVGPAGKVLAVEPVPLSFELLNRAIVLNGMTGLVETKCAAMGATREQRKLFIGNVLGHSSLIKTQSLNTETSSEIEVEVLPLDELVQANDRVDLIKIDVEGAELLVLQGTKRIIADNPELAIIAEYGPSHLQAAGISPENWFAEFHNLGFTSFVIDELSGECRSSDLNDLKQVESVNVLFVRRNSPMIRRVM
jgi:FkbM family methyltransferase